MSHRVVLLVIGLLACLPAAAQAAGTVSRLGAEISVTGDAESDSFTIGYDAAQGDVLVVSARPLTVVPPCRPADPPGTSGVTRASCPAMFATRVAASTGEGTNAVTFAATLSASSLASLSATGGDGNDVLDNGSDKPVVFRGRAGADAFSGGTSLAAVAETVDYTGHHGPVRAANDGTPSGVGCLGGRACEGDTIDGAMDSVVGTDGDDVLSVEAGAGALAGGAGDDVLSGGAGPDRLDGGAGKDTVTYAGRSAGVAVDLAAGSGPDGDVLTGLERAVGGSGDDRLVGSDGGNVLIGGPGADRIEAGGGDDEIDSADREQDVDGCGSGNDRVRADDVDLVETDCEAVTRVVTRPSPGVPAVPTPPAKRSLATVVDASAKEGDSGALRPMSFPISLDRPQTAPVSVSWRTEQASARGGSDYRSRRGVVTFAPGRTSAAVAVVVRGDRRRESDERFILRLAGVTGNARIARSRGVGTILDDEARGRPRPRYLSVRVTPRRDTTAPFTFDLRVLLGLPRGTPRSECTRPRIIALELRTRYRTVARSRIPLSRSCQFRFRFTLPSVGTFRVRARYVGTKRIAPFGPREAVAYAGPRPAAR